jgi:hypothetical protein
MKPEILLDNHARRHMIRWSLKFFKLGYPRLFKSIVGAIEEAMALNSKDIKLNQTVYHMSVYDGKEPLRVVGIRENQLELEGDYSGGTHCVCQKDWLSIEGVLLKKNEK